ncbi:hypothetical protein JCM21900_001131 [Sporobolomyces salmonicolor]|uniref:Mating pheromone receptor n=2 Tax=Sporidiobolus salmonicolor TaxID=5005 RepID=E0XNN8_SPOSA|nr:mating pheromone receptor [Sporobolomyces salmonicolor]
MFSPVFLVFNFLGIFFLLLPVVWHWRARNTATLLFIFWCLVTVVPLALNSAIWYSQADLKAPVYCDIVAKLRVGGDVGVPAAILCITRQLEAIAAARQAHFSAKDRRRRCLVDLAIGLGIPVLVMILHTIVQGHRYDIYQRVGCVSTMYWSLPTIFLVVIWPIVLLLAAAVYAGLATRLFIVRRRQFAKMLESSKSAISTSRFIRLIALSALQIAYSLPITIALQTYNLVELPLEPYISWSNVHYGFDYVGTYTLDELQLYSPRVSLQLVELSYWSYPLSCAFFFLFFGLGEESITAYRDGITLVGQRLGFRRRASSATGGGVQQSAAQISLPPYPRSEHSFIKEHDLEKDELDLPQAGVLVTVQEDDYTSV